MIFAIDVHLVGGDPWWHELIGPALLAATAIAAAWIAARTANHRQQEQLNHDRELQADQLAYDREQRNRQHVRDVVDEALKGVDAAIRLITEFEAKIMVGDAARNKHRDELAAERDSPIMRPSTALSALREETAEIHALGQATYDASIDLTSENLRLAIRLGNQHPIVVSHQAFRDAYSARHDSEEPLYHRPLTEDDRSTILSAGEVGGTSLAGFFDECRKWFEEG